MSTPRTKAALWIAPAVTIAALFGSYGIASATGGWVTSGKQVITASTKLTPDDLKGWMTLQQASDGLGIGVDRLIALLDAPAGTAIAPATAFKDLEALVPGDVYKRQLLSSGCSRRYQVTQPPARCRGDWP